MVARDFHKRGDWFVATPGGPALIAGMLVPLLVLYLLSGAKSFLVVTLSLLIVFIVGLIDDLYGLDGVEKPVLLLLGGVPVLLLEAYVGRLAFPFVSPFRITVVYPLLIPVTITVVANAFNMLDIFNGSLVGISVIVFSAQIFSLLYFGQVVTPAIAFIALGALLAFFVFNRYPSRIFLGDSGSLSLGGLFAVLSIAGKVEVPALVSILPAVFNSFFIIYTLRGFVERREIKKRPLFLDEEGRLCVSRDQGAPLTLARILLSDGPLTEKEATKRIFIAFFFSAALSMITALVTEWG